MHTYIHTYIHTEGGKWGILNIKTGGTYSYQSALNGYGSSKPWMGEIEQH